MKITPEEVVRMRLSGATQREIAEKAEVSTSRIYCLLKEIKYCHHRRKPSYQKLRELLLEGKEE